jgi:HEAT repeat protein
MASTGLGAEEIPFILTEIDDPEARSVIELFLRHRDAEVIAAAIEALADLEDPLALDALAELADDERKVKVDEAIAADEEWTIGQLARDAIEMLTGEEEEEEE